MNPRSGHGRAVNNEPISNIEGRFTQYKSTVMSGYCTNCLTDSFPFCNNSDGDFYDEINLKYMNILL